MIYSANLNITTLSGAGLIRAVASIFTPSLVGWNPDRTWIASLLERHRDAGTAPAMVVHSDAERAVGFWEGVGAHKDGLHLVGQIHVTEDAGRTTLAQLQSGALDRLTLMFSGDATAAPGLGERSRRYVGAELSAMSFSATAAAPRKAPATADSPRAIEAMLRGAGVSNRRAKVAGAAAWRAMIGTAESEAETLSQILNDATGALSRFKGATTND